MVSHRSPKPKMDVRFVSHLLDNVRESMGWRLNLQIHGFMGRKRALSKKILGCRQEVLRHSALTAALRQFESDQPSSFLIIYIFAVLVQNGIAAVLKTVVRKGMGVRIPQTAFRFA